MLLVLALLMRPLPLLPSPPPAPGCDIARAVEGCRFEPAARPLLPGGREKIAAAADFL